jgi:ADP-ribose pyrophosphatase YjhB (NUDIX family)
MDRDGICASASSYDTIGIVTDTTEPSLAVLRELAAIAQNGLTFTKDVYDRERYTRLLEIVNEVLGAPSPSLRRFDPGLVLKEEEGYITPKLDVRGAAFRDNRVLMVRERSDGKWTLPGGWADVNYSPADAILKEIREESGFEARVVKIAAVWDRRRHGHPPSFQHVYKMFFLCELTGGSASESIETDGVDFFAEDSLPPLSVGRATEAQIHTMFRHARDPDRPTEFD